ncbi:restriction endonuclease subunit S [Rhodanobacter aciditrophus]|uniref:Restriction endonuclease subunit S n=1 Tax=Rhodanobacter aciditrophus TaxID=1623218 RepID=A0ABW4B2E1_9GAMM
MAELHSLQKDLPQKDKVQQLITQHIDLWTGAVKDKSSAGRGGSSKRELYGIKKLRELILELAVRGKLVAQDPNDEPASVLLERIAAEKAELVKQGKIKKPKKLPEISEEEKPFELPEGWELCRIGELFNSIMSGGTPSKRNNDYWDGDIPWASVKDLGSSLYLSQTQDHITELGLENGSKEALKGDLLICTRMGLGKIAIVEHRMAFNQDLKAVSLTSFLLPLYFVRFYSTLKIIGTGTTVAGITQEQLLNYTMALPPKAEQQRIVAKVDELMALCDLLEQQTESSLDAHQTLVQTLLDTLLQSADAEELEQNWQRLSAHFDLLFTTEQSIDQLKQTILQLAVMGKLVPQDPNDEPASELLKRIAAEKEELVKQKKIKKQKPLPPISDDEKPFQLPKGWEWCRADDICYGITSGSTPPKTEFSDGEGVPYLKVYNIRNQKIDFEYQPQFVNESYHMTKLARSILKPGDVVMNIVGPPLGKIAIIPSTYDEWNCNQAIVFFRAIDSRLRFYIYQYLVAGLFLNSIELIGTAGQDNISVTKSRSIVIPMPPLSEQNHIVAKVDQLMALCDQLKAKLADSKTTQLNLTDALVAQAV